MFESLGQMIVVMAQKTNVRSIFLSKEVEKIANNIVQQKDFLLPFCHFSEFELSVLSKYVCKKKNKNKNPIILNRK